MKKRIFITLLIFSLLANLPILALASRDIDLYGTTVEEVITIDGIALPDTWVSLKITDKDNNIVYFSGVKTGGDSKYSFDIDLIGYSLPLDGTITYQDNIETFQIKDHEEASDPDYEDGDEGNTGREDGGNTGTGKGGNIGEIHNSRNIKSIQIFEDIRVKTGTPIDLLDLPKKIEVILGNREKVELEVKWDTSNYNGQVPGEYKLEGSLILSKGITNKDKIKAYINIVVLDDNIITFTDINDHWAKSYIEFMASNKYIKGKGNKIFDPDGKITRAEFTAILARMSGDELKSVETKFYDVNPDDWFASYIIWAVNKGITKGVSNTKFAPSDNITREQMAVMIRRYADSFDIKLDMTQGPVTFKDEDTISDYALASVKKMQRFGLIQGRPGNIFDPKGNATRAEACKMLGLLIKSITE